MRNLFIVFGFLFLQFTGFVHATIPASERAALIALYTNTNGRGWSNNSGWQVSPLFTDGFAMPGTEGSWYGVTVIDNHVTSLSLVKNNLEGRIPSQLENLSNLKNLNLQENQLYGAIPAVLGNLDMLENLNLYFNDLDGLIPAELGNLSNLTHLNLSYNNLKNYIPSQLGNLSKLKNLDLQGSSLVGSIPATLGNLDKLENLELQWNHLSGSIPAELGNLVNLKNLNIKENDLNGSLPATLGNLGQLESLDLQWNQLGGSIPATFGNLGKLENLDMHFNELSGSLPAELGNLSNLKYFALGSNQLSGSIPPTLGNLGKLEKLDLDVNQLSGSIPATLGNLGKLENLNLGVNQLSGSIPPELGNLNNLNSFYLGSNQLSGSIPPELGNLSNLTSFGVNHNQLSGSLPSTLGNLSHLKYFWLHYNQLSGSIPTSYINLSDTSSIRIKYNCLYTTDSTIIQWLDSSDPRWEATQCLEKAAPFGEFATPLDSSSVSGSIAVTGWALDDYGIDSVKIYLAQDNTLTYIGDAIFIEGARPDVAIAYPEYPDKTKAGWGYMLLTHFLPNGGNGTYTLHAIATDKYGKTTPLGTKTITVNNASAVKPFGAIDTPIQGDTISGDKFRSNGWALTPMPNKIATNGSTINVFIDGKSVGNAIYNLYRSDIAALFPGYANSNNAWGYFDIKTINYSDEMHTIQWTVTDNAGNTDGIGSRYFNIHNYADLPIQATDNSSALLERQSGKVSRAFKHNQETNEAECIQTDMPQFSMDELNALSEESQTSVLVSKELERVEIPLGENCATIQGYLINGNELNKLPIGSTLDPQSGTFYWSPGPGFLGRYSLVFVLTDATGHSFKRFITIKIEPKQ